MEDPELAALQAAMIEALMSDASGEEASQGIEARAPSAELKRWVRGWDRRSVVVARAILAKWVVRERT
jgi:hypothetical protein